MGKIEISGIILLTFVCFSVAEDCSIPKKIQGTWYSWEKRNDSRTEIDSEYLTQNGDKHKCVVVQNSSIDNEYILVFQENSGCYKCVKIFERNPSVLEKKETPCINYSEQKDAVEDVCHNFHPYPSLTTLFSENFAPVECRSFIEGVWNFANENKLKFTGECRNSEAQIRSCKVPVNQLLLPNRRFNIQYRKCEDVTDYEDVEYACLGDWFVGDNHYFAAANTKESRKDKKYRCFLKNEESLLIGASVTAECKTLASIETSPERLQLTPVKEEVLEATCRLPKNFSGEWLNSENIDSQIFINETHIIETHRPDNNKNQKATYYACREIKESKIMMAKLTINGCLKEYVCFDFVSQEHNMIRYKKGVAVIKDDYSTVCSSTYLPDKEKQYLFLSKSPIPIKCPVTGKFTFTQKGDIPFETRPVQGITLGPRPGTHCKENVPIFSVCDTNQEEINIDADYCFSVDYLGRSVATYSEPDYRMKCIGYWKENNKSYLISYDRLDSTYKYKCWVYERSASNKIFMSQAFGSFCDHDQNAKSHDYSLGVQVAIELSQYNKKYDDCPMHFDDGSPLI